MNKTEHERKRLAEQIIHVSRASGVGGAVGERGDSKYLALFGVKVGALRRAQGLGLEETARKADMDPEALLAIELGRASLQEITRHLRALSRALGGRYRELSELLINLAIGE